MSYNHYGGQGYQQQQPPQRDPYGTAYPDDSGPYNDGYHVDGAGYGDDQYGYGEYRDEFAGQPAEGSFAPYNAGPSYYNPDVQYGAEEYIGEAGPPRAPTYPMSSPSTRTSAAGEVKAANNDKFFAPDASYHSNVDDSRRYNPGPPMPPVGYLHSPRVAPTRPAAAGYASTTRPSFGSGFSHLSSATTVRSHNPSVATSVTYAASSAASMTSSGKGRTLLKDRYNPNGPLEKDHGADPFVNVGSGTKRKRRGGMGKCCCVTSIILILLVAIIVAAFFLLLKQPEIRFLGVEQSGNGSSAFSTDQFKFSMNFQLKVGVKNPNMLGITFENVEGDARFKDISPVTVGSGNLKNVVVGQNSDQVVSFPFSINYDPANDPGSKILLYVAKSCGFLGGTKAKLEVDYTLKFSIKFLSSLGIKPAFSNTASFNCPLGAGQTLPNIAGLAGGSAPSGPSRQ